MGSKRKTTSVVLIVAALASFTAWSEQADQAALIKLHETAWTIDGKPAPHREGVILFWPEPCAAAIEKVKDSPNRPANLRRTHGRVGIDSARPLSLLRAGRGLTPSTLEWPRCTRRSSG